MLSELNLEQTETELRRRKAEIQAEINSYPGPIAGCDQQFNYLLEQRAAIRQKLREIEQLRQEARSTSR